MVADDFTCEWLQNFASAKRPGKNYIKYSGRRKYSGPEDSTEHEIKWKQKKEEKWQIRCEEKIESGRQQRRGYTLHDTIRSTSAFFAIVMTTVCLCLCGAARQWHSFPRQEPPNVFVFAYINSNVIFFRIPRFDRRERHRDLVFNFKFQHNFNVYTLHLSFRPFGDIFSCFFRCCWTFKKKNKSPNHLQCWRFPAPPDISDRSGRNRWVKLHSEISFDWWNYKP